MLLTIGTFSQHYKDYLDKNFYLIKEKIGDQQSIKIIVKVLDKKKVFLKTIKSSLRTSIC
jgi:hypothetical protein